MTEAKEYYDEWKKCEAERDRLREALNGLLSNALLGSQTDDDIVRDYGMLALSQVERARAALEADDASE